MNPLSFLTGKVSDVITAVGGVLDKVTTTDAERLDAKNQLFKLHSDLTLGLAEADTKIAEAQSKVLIAEATSESWLTRNWRPILMLTFTGILLHNYVLAPIFGLPSTDMPSDLWQVIKIGVGGYIASRGVENVASYAPDVAAALRPSSTPSS